MISETNLTIQLAMHHTYIYNRELYVVVLIIELKACDVCGATRHCMQISGMYVCMHSIYLIFDCRVPDLADLLYYRPNYPNKCKENCKYNIIFYAKRAF